MRRHEDRADAAHHLPAHPESRLLVVGRDSNPARYEKIADELGIGDRVSFAGGRRDPEVCY